MRKPNRKGDGSPVPRTGHAIAQYDMAATLREVAAMKAFKAIVVPHAPQEAVMARIEALRLKTLGIRGVPLPGLRLSERPQAGKSKTLERYRLDLAKRMAEEESEPNPYQVLYLNLRTRVTVKMICQQLLRSLGDPHSDQGNTDQVLQRASEFMMHRCVELLIVDEVQHLSKARNDSNEVTDELKNFLDAGIVPLVLAGNLDSKKFFERNDQLASRLGSPLELSPLDPKLNGQAKLFKAFCINLDNALFASGATRQLSGFGQSEILGALLKASSGHVGRVCRVVEAALEHAARRDADYIETYDLSFAVRTFAIPQEYVFSDPFAEGVA